jgi:predicted NBD/HSP70 family sugar kinase
VAAGGNLDTLRRANLSNVLRIVHHRRGASRAEITAALGLNRSTVAALVTELEELGLVVEGAPLRTLGRGRPSPVVSPDPRPVVLAVNPEVDAVEIGVVGLGASVIAHVRVPVDHVPDPSEVVDIVARTSSTTLRSALRGRRIVAAGVAIPGLVRAADGLVAWAPHLDWREVPFSAMLASRLGAPAITVNDANAGAIAESIFGAGSGYGNLVYLNGGASGIGAGVIVDGRTLLGESGFAAEFGHVRVWIPDPADRRTDTSVFEDEVNRARLLAAADLASGDDEQLTAAIRAKGDRKATASEIARQRRILAAALGDIVNIVNPEIIVLGGFLALLAETDDEDLRRGMAETALPMPLAAVTTVAAALGADRLLVGAAEFGFATLIDNPPLET